MKVVLQWIVAAISALTPLAASAHSFQGLRRSAHAVDLKQQADRDFAFAALRQSLAAKSHEAIKSLAVDDPRAFGFAIQLDAWPRSANLRVCFYPDPRFKWFEGARAIVMKLYAETLAYTTLTATDVGLCAYNAGDIRIKFRNPDDDWSEVGKTGSLAAKPGEPTMGLASLAGDGPTPDSLGLTRHEILHSLGFQHEHQRPDIDCDFRPARVVARFLGWPIAAVRDNFDRIDPKTICKASLGACAILQSFDRKSVMLYQLEPKFFREGRDSACYIDKQNNDLSELDIKTLEALYPK